MYYNPHMPNIEWGGAEEPTINHLYTIVNSKF